MIKNYRYNETLKRFEPLEKKCTYCDLTQISNIDDCYYIPLFLTKDTTNLLVYRSVKFDQISIGIPRCTSCKNIHENSSSKAANLSIGFALLIIIFLFYNLVSFGGVIVALGLIGIISCGNYGYKYLRDSFSRDKGIYTPKDGAETNEVILDLVLSGWSLEKPAP